MKIELRFQSLALTVIVVSAVCLSSCRGTQGGKNSPSEVSSNNDTQGHGLNVNDVSLLFPLPSDKNELDKMLPMTFANNEGKQPMSAKLFAEMLKSNNYNRDIPEIGPNFPLNSGASFEGKTRIESLLSMRADDQAKWRIVAMRYDLCAPSPEHNRLQNFKMGSGALPMPMPEQWKPEECLPQLRLTAQPLEMDEKIKVGDFAIHMLFRLTEEETRNLYQELKGFRDLCRDIGSGLPLGVQPCLAFAQKSGRYGSEEFNFVYTMIKKYAKNLEGLAMMATAGGDDPWLFMNGTVKDGNFVHQKIDAVTQKDPAKLKRNAQGRVVEPFGNGFFQMISFLDTQGRLDNLIDIKRTSPLPILENVSFALESKHFNMTTRVVEPADPKLFNLIENPLASDFFSTDCASCHAVSGSSRFKTNKVIAKVSPDQEAAGFPAGFYTSGNPRDPTSSFEWQRAQLDSAFRIEAAYAAFVDPAVQTQSDTFVLNAFIHFGYFHGRPAVSPRTAQESGLVARMANKAFARGALPSAKCSSQEIKQCFMSQRFADRGGKLNNIDWIIDAQNEAGLCYIEVCKDSAELVKALYGEQVKTWYLATEDVKVLPLKGKFSQPMFIRKGSSFVSRDYVYSGYPWESQNLVPLEDAQGNRVYTKTQNLNFNAKDLEFPEYRIELERQFVKVPTAP